MRHAKQIGGELGQLAGPVHRLGIDEVRRQDFRIAVLPCVQVEHEIGQRPLQPRTQAPVNRKTRSGQLDRAL